MLSPSASPTIRHPTSLPTHSRCSQMNQTKWLMFQWSQLLRVKKEADCSNLCSIAMTTRITTWWEDSSRTYPWSIRLLVPFRALMKRFSSQYWHRRKDLTSLRLSMIPLKSRAYNHARLTRCESLPKTLQRFWTILCSARAMKTCPRWFKSTKMSLGMIKNLKLLLSFSLTKGQDKIVLGRCWSKTWKSTYPSKSLRKTSSTILMCKSHTISLQPRWRLRSLWSLLLGTDYTWETPLSHGFKRRILTREMWIWTRVQLRDLDLTI